MDRARLIATWLGFVASAWVAAAFFMQIVPISHAATTSPAEKFTYLFLRVIHGPPDFRDTIVRLTFVIPHAWAMSRLIAPFFLRGMPGPSSTSTIDPFWCLAMLAGLHALAGWSFWVTWNDVVTGKIMWDYTEFLWLTGIGPLLGADLISLILVRMVGQRLKSVSGSPTARQSIPYAALSALYGLVWFLILEAASGGPLYWYQVGLQVIPPPTYIELRVTMAACLVLLGVEALLASEGYAKPNGGGGTTDP